MKILTLILIGAAFLGAQLFAVPLGFANLSLYRLAFALALVFYIFLVLKGDHSLKRQKNSLTNKLPFVYLTWLVLALISGVWVSDLKLWVQALFFVGMGSVSIWLITSFIKSKEDLTRALGILVGVSWIHHFLGWLEVLFGFYLYQKNPNVKVVVEGIPISSFGNQNDYATMLLASFAASLILIILSKSYRAKIVNFLALISGTLLIYLTDSRANLLAILALLGSCFLVWMVKNLSRKAWNRLILLVIGVGLLLSLTPPFRGIINKLAYMVQNLDANTGETNFNRINLLVNGLLFLANSFGLGVGAGNIDYYMSYFSIVPVNRIQIHNWWAEIATAYGIGFFILYLLMYAFLIYYLYQTIRHAKDKASYWGSTVFLAYLVSFVLSSISSASIIYAEWQWVFFGIILAWVNYCERVLADQQANWGQQYLNLLSKDQLAWYLNEKGGSYD